MGETAKPTVWNESKFEINHSNCSLFLVHHSSRNSCQKKEFHPANNSLRILPALQTFSPSEILLARRISLGHSMKGQRKGRNDLNKSMKNYQDHQQNKKNVRPSWLEIRSENLLFSLFSFRHKVHQ